MIKEEIKGRDSRGNFSSQRVFFSVRFSDQEQKRGKILRMSKNLLQAHSLSLSISSPPPTHGQPKLFHSLTSRKRLLVAFEGKNQGKEAIIHGVKEGGSSERVLSFPVKKGYR